MEILVLAALALAFVLTFCAVIIKLLWIGCKLTFGLILLPAKMLGAVAGGALELSLIPLKLTFVMCAVVGIVVGLVLIPLLIPVLLILGFFYLLVVC